MRGTVANLLTNPGFELHDAGDPTDWTGVNFASSESAYGYKSGARALSLLMIQEVIGIDPVTGDPILGDWLTPMATQTVSVTAGDTYEVAGWVKRYSGTETQVRLRVKNPSSGAWQTVDSLDEGDEWERLSGLLVAAGDEISVRWDVERLGSTNGQWLADDAGVYEMAITRSIKSALVSDLEHITEANGYSKTLAEAGLDPKDWDEAKYPAVYVIPDAGGSSELETLSNLKGEAEQAFTLQLVLKSNTPNTDMDNFLDDVRNAVERSAGNLNALAGVEFAGITEWSEVLTVRDEDFGLYYREATLTVRYLYDRGGA